MITSIPIFYMQHVCRRSHVFLPAGLVGFARLMPGDVFEITLRHGHQKWKTKSRINTNTQTWDSDTALMKALVGEVLTIKVNILINYPPLI